MKHIVNGAGMVGALLLVALPTSAVHAQGGETLQWPDSFVGRLEAMAVLQTLNAQLLSHDSATLTLEHWCAQHHLASPAQISAQRVHDVEKPADATIRQQLQVGPNEAVRYRRVSLQCGEVVLSEADNWYVPGRLTGDMAQRLDQTDEPFGKVVQPLHFQRHTLSALLLWTPLPDGWEMQNNAASAPGRHALVIPATVLEHHAVLSLPDGTPFSALTETYSSNVLAFTPDR